MQEQSQNLDQEKDKKPDSKITAKGEEILDKLGVPTDPKLYNPDADLVDPDNKVGKGPIRFGLFVFALVFGVFGVWSAFAPLDSAAIAPGQVVVDSNRQTIQHLEGGIIQDILVKDGDQVTAGQPIVNLSEIAARSRLQLLRGQFLAARAKEARLLAERDGTTKINWPKEVLAAKDQPEIADIIDTQTRLIISRDRAINGQIDILNQKIKQYDEEIDGLSSQEKSTVSQLGYIKEEADVVEKLVKQGNAQRPRLLALRRHEAELQGRRGEYLSMIARANQSIMEARLEIINHKNKFTNEVIADLRETQQSISDLREQINASADVLDRIVITSPIDGIVNNLQFFTQGGVISPGEPIMDIVPIEVQRVVEARVRPEDIDVVHVGLEARVRLSAYKTRTVPTLEGTVIHVSADSITDQHTGERYFRARVEIPDSSLAKLAADVELYPGMSAEVFIVTGEQTLLQYLISPLTSSFRKAFREI